MPMLIIICGVPGSGKTTLANELSKKLSIVCFHKDSIKEQLYDALNLSTLDDSKHIGAVSIKVLLHLAEEQLARGIDIILEGAFGFTEDADLFNQWEKTYDLNIFNVICEIDDSEREKRFRTRDRHQAHHDEERTLLPDELEKYRAIYKQFPGQAITVKTDQPVELLIPEIVRAIVKPK